jgi:hypothetical protein
MSATRRSGSSCRRLPGTGRTSATGWHGVNAEWRSVLTDAFEQPHRELHIAMPLDALVTLVMTFNQGIVIERLGGVEAGHVELLNWIDGFLQKRQ